MRHQFTKNLFEIFEIQDKCDFQYKKNDHLILFLNYQIFLQDNSPSYTIISLIKILIFKKFKILIEINENVYFC